MDQGAIDGAMGGASDGSGSNRRSLGSEEAMDVASECSGELWVVQAMDQGVIGRCERWIMINRRSDGWCKLWIRERWIRRSDGSESERSRSNRRSYGWCKRWIREL